MNLYSSNPGNTSPHWIHGKEPNPDQGIAFSIGNWDIHTYSLTMAFAMLFSVLTIVYFWKRQKYSMEHLQVLTLIIIPTSIICARLWHVIYASTDKVNYGPGSGHEFIASRDWYKIWEGGLAIQGGVIGAAIAGVLYVITKRKSIDLRIASDYILPAVLVGQAIGRWGNFANHEVYGAIDPNGKWSKWLGDYISDNMYIGGEYRIPLFFYEFVTSMVGVILLVFVLNVFNWQRPGTTGGGYFLWYGLVRVIMEPLRPSGERMMWGKLDAGIFTSVVYIVVGLAIIINAYTNYMHVVCKYVKAIYVATKKADIKNFKKYISKNGPTKYTRVNIEQKYFFVAIPLKIAVVFYGIYKSIFGRNKRELAVKLTNEKIKKAKGNTFVLIFKKIVIETAYVWNLMFSSSLYRKAVEEKSKEFSKLKCMNWRFKSNIWVRESELKNFK